LSSIRCACAGVIAYQTVAPRPEQNGSSSAVVAWDVSIRSSNGRLSIAVAAANSSFAGPLGGGGTGATWKASWPPAPPPNAPTMK
jgi:hypothetical protein